MPGQHHDRGVIKVLFLHEAHGETGNHRLNDHEAQAEHQQAPDDGNRDLFGPAFQQVSPAAAVPFPETAVLSDKDRIVFTHRISPPPG